MREVETTPDYRLYALPGTVRRSPACCASRDGEGAAIEAEIWSLDAAGFGAFVAKIPRAARHRHAAASPTAARRKGFLVEAEAVQGGGGHFAFGGWRAYLASR